MSNIFGSFKKKRKLRTLAKKLSLPSPPSDLQSFQNYMKKAANVKNAEEQCLDELWTIVLEDAGCREVIDRHGITREALGSWYHTLASGGLIGPPTLYALADAETLNYIFRNDVTEAEIINRVNSFSLKHGR